MKIPVLSEQGVIALARGEITLGELQGFARCPGCGKIFEPGHAARKPRYCEDCGARLVWGE